LRRAQTCAARTRLAGNLPRGELGFRA
jgi:hypothetical protein